MGNRVYGFYERNGIGKKGEELIVKLFPTKFTATDGMSGDMLYNGTDGITHKFELKTDTYKSNNFFFEKFSNVRLQNNGGVWQSKDHGCKYYAYYMIKYDELYIFEVDKILDWLNNNEHKYPIKPVKNNTKITEGYAIPMDDVSSVVLKKIVLTKVSGYTTLKEEYGFL